VYPRFFAAFTIFLRRLIINWASSLPRNHRRGIRLIQHRGGIGV